MAFRFDHRRTRLAERLGVQPSGGWASPADALQSLRHAAHHACGEACGDLHALADDASTAAACVGHFDDATTSTDEKIRSARNRARNYAEHSKRLGGHGDVDGAEWTRILAGLALGHALRLDRPARSAPVGVFAKVLRRLADK